MTEPKRILVVEDEVEILNYTADLLRKRGYDVATAASGDDAVSLVESRKLLPEDQKVNLVITDLRMPGLSGVPLISRLMELMPEVPIIVQTAYDEIDNRFHLLDKGAYDVISKSYFEKDLHFCVAKALRYNATQVENRQLRQRLEEEHELIVGDEEVTRPLLDKARTVAETDFPVLLMGESGTGKEVFARYIHRHQTSARLTGPFVTVNCPSIPRDLFESEFFGHARGSFTGAHADRKGLFEAAQGGTIFLDEVSEVAVENQVKLLRVLQENEVKRVGEQVVRQVDVRLICATNRDLRAAVREGRFREDLYYRIKVFPIRIPPLRERPGDILPLARHFLEHESIGLRPNLRRELSKEAMAKLLAYSWPGNVRELRNVLRQAILLTTGERIGAEDLILEDLILEEESNEPRPSFGRKIPHLREARERWTRNYLETLLQSVGGNISRAAEQSGKHRSELYEMLNRYKIDLARFRGRYDDPPSDN